MGRRHTMFIQTLNPYFPYSTILYRKGKENDADPLSRRADLDISESHFSTNPEIPCLIDAYDTTSYEKELSDFQDFLGGMFHLLLDENLQQKIVKTYTSDPQYSKPSLPTGVILDRTTNLYYKADKICLPNNKKSTK